MSEFENGWKDYVIAQVWHGNGVIVELDSLNESGTKKSADSSFAQSLQQAIVGTFLLLVPMVMLSGFATPISSMPEIFQDLTLLNPMRYGLELIQRIFLEGAGFLDLWPLFAAIMTVTVVAVLAAIFSFHHKIS